jgi:DNA repair protein RadC
LLQFHFEKGRKRKTVTEFRDGQVTQHSLWTQGTEIPDTEHSRTTVRHLRERLQASGASVLSTAELIAIVCGTGSSTPGVIRNVQTLVASMSLPELLTIDFGELSTIHLLGESTAAQLQAVFELARRLTIPTAVERYQIITPADAANLVMAERKGKPSPTA